MHKGHSDNLDKELVANCFRASAATYEESAIVQKEISRQLIAILQRFTRIDYLRVLEIGCCTGNLTEMLSKSAHIDSLFINDLVPDFCACTEDRIAEQVGQLHSLPGDIEKTLLPKNLDLVISSSTFQWMVDLPGLIENIAAALNEAGHLAFSIFSPGTMGEINILTGRGLKYHTNEELCAMLTDHFQIINVHSEKKCLFFPTVRSVLRHIRETGVGGVEPNRWNLRKLKDFERRYAGQFLSEDGFPVTYISTFIIAEKKKRDNS
ncbi:MAG: methyltransferase domain-containing protein [Proteobacteria bacterium]|nr:methyltransferase domain-containing protein [Pseudomonadota bacterium]